MPEVNNTARIAKERLLSIPLEGITKAFIEEMFAAYHDKQANKFMQAQFNMTDQVQLTPKEYKYVKDTITTTLGRIVFNRYILEQSTVIQYIGYYNNPITQDNINDLDDMVAHLLMDDTIDIDHFSQYIDSRDRLGFWCTSFTSTSVSAGLLRPMKDVEKRKKELMKENEAAINSQSPVTQIMAVNKIEKELMGMVRKNLENDPGYDMYASGDGNLDNNYKNINVMMGPVFNDVTKRYDVVDSSLMNGVTKKDIPAFANSVIAGAYPSAIGTAEAGYMGKIVMAILQNEHLDPNIKSDCGTKMTIPVTITKLNKNYFLYRNFNINGKIVMSTPQNISSFVDKTVNMYSPQCCTHTSICAKCAGLIYHKMGVQNIGLLSSDFTDKFLNLKLKSKHDLSTSADSIRKDYIFGKDNKYYDVDKEGYLITKARMRCFIPRMFEEFKGFVAESTCVDSMAVFPVRFYDKNDNEIFKTTMIIPAVLTFFVYSDIQETKDHYIITYDPDSKVCSLNIQQTYVNAEFFINQVYLYSTTPQLPYHLIAEMTWRCFEINKLKLDGISIVYELMARALCRYNNKPFALEYGKGGVDPMSYEKLRYREVVQRSNILSALMFEDVSASLNIGLSQTLNNIPPTDTPLEKIIKA